MNSVRSIRLSAISRASSSAAISARRSSMSASMVDARLVQSLARAPGGHRGRGRRGPGTPAASGDFLPVTDAATWRMSSVESAAATAARASFDQVVDVQGRGHRGCPPAPPPIGASGVMGDRSIPGIVGRGTGSPGEGRPGPCSSRRWRRASKQSTAADTLTLSDSARPTIGYRDPLVERPGHRRRSSPEASLPKTSATRWRQSKSA